MIIGILCIVIEAVIFGYIVKRIAESKQISLKDTTAYPFLFVITLLLVFYGKLKYGSAEPWYGVLPTALSAALSLLTLKLDGDITALFRANDTVFLVGYLAAYAISAVALFSISISLLKVTVANFFRGKHGKQEIDYVFSLSEDARKYILNLDKKAREKTVVVLQKRNDVTYDEERLFLDDQKVKLCVEDFDDQEAFLKTMRKLTRYKNAKKFYFVSFLEKEAEIRGFILHSKAFLKELKESEVDKMQFIVSAQPSQSVYVRELIQGYKPDDLRKQEAEQQLVDESKGCIRYYDKYGIMAFDFIQKHNFAKHFPAELLNEDATVKDCFVNLFVLGFGKVNQALLKDVLINTQFVKKQPCEGDPKKFVLRPIRLDVVVFDQNKNSSNLGLSTGIMKYDRSEYNEKEYFELPEDYRSHIRFVNEINAEGIGCFDAIRKVLAEERAKDGEKPIVNYYLVSLGTDFENVAIAQKLIDCSSLEKTSNVVFVRTENKSLLEGLGEDSIVGFGDSGSCLSYDTVIADELYNRAKYLSCVYSGEKTTPENVEEIWRNLTKIEQDSNIYSVAGLFFKLSLLGANGDTFNSIPREEAMKRYDPENRRAKKPMIATKEEFCSVYGQTVPRCSFYPRDVIAFSEHERWLAFEMSLGVLPLKKSSIESYRNNKSPNQLFHSCLTTTPGLVDYYCHISELKEGGKYPKDKNADVIGYDYNVTDSCLEEKEKRIAPAPAESPEGEEFPSAE